MTGPGLPGVHALLDRALEAYRGDAAATAALLDRRQRLGEPLRIALVGRVKAGKSTLLNALVGERLAPTDAGECTRVVTWYRHGPMPAVTVESLDGGVSGRPVRREHGDLVLDLGGTPVEDVARVVVDWPATALARTTLIDTPGLASIGAAAGARAEAFLTATARPDPAPTRWSS